jgi:hypothetical protein
MDTFFEIDCNMLMFLSKKLLGDCVLRICAGHQFSNAQLKSTTVTVLLSHDRALGAHLSLRYDEHQRVTQTFSMTLFR